MAASLKTETQELVIKRGSTQDLLKRNLTADRIGKMDDVEENPDDLFNNRTEIKIQ